MEMLTFITRWRTASAAADQLAQGRAGAETDLQRALEHLRAHARGAYEAGDIVGISDATKALQQIEAEIEAQDAKGRAEHRPREPLR